MKPLNAWLLLNWMGNCITSLNNAEIKYNNKFAMSRKKRETGGLTIQPQLSVFPYFSG
jgi:hypothetical protein